MSWKRDVENKGGGIELGERHRGDVEKRGGDDPILYQ